MNKDRRMTETKQNYVIRWRSNVNGSTGTGKRSFDREEAERLATELNEEYPEIQHEAILLEAPNSQPVSEANPALRSVPE